MWLLLVFLLLIPVAGWGQSEQLLDTGTPILFADSAQTPQANWTLTGLTNNNGQCSARFAMPAVPRPYKFRWRCSFQVSVAPTANGVNAVEVYASTSNGTDADGTVATTVGALGSTQRFNLLLLGNVVVDTTSTNVDMIASGTVDLWDSHVSLCAWNATGQTFRADTSVHGCTLTPLKLEQQ